MRSAAVLPTALALALAVAPSQAGERGPPLAEWGEVPVVTLHEAAKLRMVDVRGTRADGYKAIHLELANRSDDRLVVDVAGSHLLPERRGSCQRLGIGPAVTPSAAVTREDGSLVVQLEPRETRELEVQTCCLDARRAVPREQRFVAARLPLPAHRRNVLRWWAENPDVPQSFVNSAIWRDAEQVTLPTGFDATAQRPVTRALALHGGIAYQLTTGELTALDAEGVRRFLGTEIAQVVPTDDAVYAVADGEDGEPDLWRLAMTGDDPWSFVLDLDRSERIHRLLPAGKGAFALVTDRGVRRHSPGAPAKQLLQTDHPEHLSFHDRGRGRIQVGVYQPRVRTDPNDDRTGKSSFFELWDLDVRSGKAKLRKRFWNVEQVRCGPAGVFALSHRGVLRRFDGKSFRDFPGDPRFRRIEAVGRQVLWVSGRRSGLLAVDAKTGRVVVRAQSAEGIGTGHAHVDHVTDDLGLIVKGATIRVSARDGSRTRLESTESR